MKRVVSAILLSFVAVSVVYLIAGETRAPSGVETPAAARPNTERPQPTAHSDENVADPGNARRTRTIAYYFHGTARCATCLAMERYAREAVEQAFAAEMEAGIIEWQAVNYDESASEHFIADYGLTASALVVVGTLSRGPGRWRKLERIWDLVQDEGAFKAYVVDAVRAMLRGES